MSTCNSLSPKPTPAGASPPAIAGRLIYGVAIAWSLFQLWYASPLPYMLGFGIFGDTEARAFHLSFALFLAFTAYPALRSRRRAIACRCIDWLLAAAGICAVLYLVVFYRELAHASRPADAGRHHRRGGRRRAAARGFAAGRRPVDAASSPSLRCSTCSWGRICRA